MTINDGDGGENGELADERILTLMVAIIDVIFVSIPGNLQYYYS